MNYITKIISNKIIIIVTTLLLTMTYIGLVTVYAEGLTKKLNTKTESHGRNAPNSFKDLVNQTNPENIEQIKHDLEQQLEQANHILDVIHNKKEASNQGIMN